jgi:hypothetical protein
LLEIILRDLDPEGAITGTPKVTPAPEPTEVPAAPAETPPPAATPAPAPAKVKVSVKSPTKGHPLVDAPPPPPPAFVPPVQPTPAPVDANLTDEQREELQEAEVAARLFPEKYGGRVAELKGYYARAEALRVADPTLTEEDDAYQALVQSKPGIKPVDARKVQRKIGEEEAVQATEKRLTPKIEQIEMDAKRASLLPGVQKFVNEQWTQGVRNQITADTKSVLAAPLALALEKGMAVAEAEYPLETRVTRMVAAKSRAKVEEFLLLRNNAEKFDANKTITVNGQPMFVHKEISDFISQEGESFKRTGGKYLVRNGRQFLPRGEFIAMVNHTPAQQATFDAANWQTANYWTFNDTAIVDMMGIRMKEEAEFHVNNLRKQAERDGFAPAPKKTVGQSQSAAHVPPAEITPPRAGQRPAPGSTITPKTPEPADPSPIPLSDLVANLKMVK